MFYFMFYYMMGATSGAGTAHPSRATEFIVDFWWGSSYSTFCL